MDDRDRLERLRPIADEMLGGLHAGDAMRRRILEAAAPRRRIAARALVPALCCAALVALIGVSRLTAPGPARIETITAGGVASQPDAPDAPESSAASEGARIRVANAADISGVAGEGEATGDSLFAPFTGDIPLVAVDGRVYRMLAAPEALPEDALGEAVGSVTLFTDEPSLYGEDALMSGLSNVCDEGETVYAVAGLGEGTAVACRADGALRVFQRVSYAGRGPGSETLEETFSVRGQVTELTLSGVGTLTGDAAEAALATLFERAALVSADATAGRQTLTATLESGLRLQLGVSGDTLAGCGAWSCPEFFEAFAAAL